MITIPNNSSVNKTTKLFRTITNTDKKTVNVWQYYYSSFNTFIISHISPPSGKFSKFTGKQKIELPAYRNIFLKNDEPVSEILLLKVFR